MPHTRKNPPSATNAERVEDVSAHGVKSVRMVPQPNDTAGDPRRTESMLTFEDREAAYGAGYFAGMNHKFGLEVDDFARALLHQDARKMSGFARRVAAAKGPAWEAMIVWSGKGDD